MFKDKKISLFLIYFISILYLELIYFIFGIESISITFICTIINSLIISIILSIISSLFNEKINKFITRIFMFLLTIFFCIELLFKKILGVTFSLKTLGMSNNLNSFLKDTIKLLLNNIIYIILLFIPFILILIIRKKINYNKINIKKFLIYLLVLILNITYINIYYLINKNDSNSLYNLSHKVDNISLYKEKVGVLLSLELELKRIVLGYENTINNEINTFKEELEPVEEEITYNNLDIDFSSILQNETDNTLKQMHEYMSKETGTKKNKYTGLYKNKNLILFMAESFNSIAVDENLTPTLYKLVNSSFTFNNFYSPVILSTIGGEFQELTGLYPEKVMNLMNLE